MILLRVLILVLILVALAVAVVPVMVLINLLSDGTGFGICPGGLSACPLRYTSGPALAAYLTLTLMVVVGLIRVVSHLLRRLNRQANPVPPLSNDGLSGEGPGFEGARGDAVSDRAVGRHTSRANDG
jgi:hypothetical protein